MKHLRKFTRFLSPQLFMAGGAVKMEAAEDEILEEVFVVLNEYRLRKKKHETIFVETAIPLSVETKQEIKKALLVPSSTPLIEHINPSLGSSFQILYKNLIYTHRDGNRLEQLKTYFVQN